MMMRPRLPPASWLLLLAAAATQCPDTDETLDLRVVLSDAQGFRRNDVRWSLSAAASMDAYAAGTLVGSGNATLDAGAELALPTLCAEPGNYWLAFQRLPDECVADIELLACATPTPAPTAVPSWSPSLRPTMSKMPSTTGPSWAPTSAAWARRATTNSEKLCGASWSDTASIHRV